MEQFLIVNWIAEKFGISHEWTMHYMHVIMAVVSLLIVTFISFLAWLRLRKTSRRIIPESRGTLANIFEVLTERLVGMMEDMMGSKARSHLPLIGALFIYILVSNLLGVIPGLIPPTDNINTNLACAVVVFIYYNIAGIRAHGLKEYLKHMSGPIIWLAPLMFAVELIGHLVRPVSLSVRLFGNITGDHMVLGIFSNLTPVLVPIIFELLAIFISFIQAFVFSLLSMVYIALATASEEH